MIVVADSSPINYLVLIDAVDLLESLFGEVIVPNSVADELSSEGAPEVVRVWMTTAPGWLKIEEVQSEALVSVAALKLHLGELEAIVLAESLDADYLIMDERAGRRAAEARNLTVVGTLGVLEKADRDGLIRDFPDLLERLDATSFYMSRELKHMLLERHRLRKPD